MRAILSSAAVVAGLALALPAAAQPMSSTPPTAGAAPSEMGSSASQMGSARTGVASNANATIAVGTPVKDKTGATIGTISDVKSDASGKQVATVKMGAQTFVLDSSSFAMQNGAAVVNATQAELQAMIKKASGG